MPAQTIYVGSLPDSATNERLEEIFSEIGPVKQCFVVKGQGTDKCRGFGFVTYSMEEDAQRALKEIKDYDGKKLSLTVAKKKVKDKKKTETKPAQSQNKQKLPGIKKQLLKSRLIIRNLSFKCTEDDLKSIFEKYGNVLEAKIPLKPDGKMRGFAFVLFKNVCAAAKALKEMNLKEIKGRLVAVDWAIPKDKYTVLQQTSTSNTADAHGDLKGKKQVTEPVKKPLSSDEEESDEKESKACEDSDEDIDHSEEEDDDDEDNDEDDGVDDDDDNDDDDDVVSTNEENESDEDEEESIDKSAKSKGPKRQLPSDVNEGRTLFIRNLSFDTDEEHLEEVLLQYGELNYVKIVVHPDTEHSKGCAFAQFKAKENAEKCMAAAKDDNEKGGIRVDGRKLSIVAAVTREDAVKLKVDKKKTETGTRNLYLAREGLIRAGTKAAEGVSEADMTKRTRFEELKRAKLRNINVFVSKTRLCIHNLPKSVDNTKLRALCLQAVKGVKGVRITESRVMYDKKPEKGQAIGQSLGYGFVQFQEHEHALTALRHLNNNPNIFSAQKRPIVEFSLEDTKKLKIKEIRKQKNKAFIQSRSMKDGRKHQQSTWGQKKGSGKDGHKGESLEQKGRDGGVVQKQKQYGQYSGFHTKPEVEHVDLQNGKKRRKVLPFPSHRGPKIRLRDKGKQQVQPPKKAKPGSKRNKYKNFQMEKPSHPRNQDKTNKRPKREGDRFENLVEQYKKKLLNNSDKGGGVKRNKWFDN